jgi:hypothetical protein
MDGTHSIALCRGSEPDLAAGRHPDGARDQLATGTADRVPFLAFTGLMLLLAVPVLLEK